MPEHFINKNQPSEGFSSKIWVAVGITAVVVAGMFLFKVLFSVLLLTLAGILLAVYFHGCAGFFSKHLHLRAGWSLGLAILLNVILMTGFFLVCWCKVAAAGCCIIRYPAFNDQ